MKDVYINIRVSQDTKEKIDSLVKAKAYENITEFVREAINTQLVLANEKKGELARMVLNILENDPRVKELYKKD